MCVIVLVLHIVFLEYAKKKIKVSPLKEEKLNVKKVRSHSSFSLESFTFVAEAHKKIRKLSCNSTSFVEQYDIYVTAYVDIIYLHLHISTNLR